MTFRSDDCSSNLHDYCNKCQCECHNEETKFLTIEELKTLYKILEHQYISYTHPEHIELVRKISKIVESSE